MQVISISSLKGGVGKTSVTLGLASAARALGISTLVIDLDPHADASTGLGVRQDSPAQPIGALLRKPKKRDLTQHILPAGWLSTDELAASQGRPSLGVIRGSAVTSVHERVTTRQREVRRLSTLLENLRGYDLVLIDCPPALNGVTRMAWAASTDVLLVAEPSLFSVAGTERTLRALQQFRQEFAPSVKNVHVLANRARTNSTEHKYRLAEMERMYADKLLPLTIPEISNWQQIQGAAWSIHSWPGDNAAKAAKQFEDLLVLLAPAAAQAQSAEATDTSASSGATGGFRSQARRQGGSTGAAHLPSRRDRDNTKPQGTDTPGGSMHSRRAR